MAAAAPVRIAFALVLASLAAACGGSDETADTAPEWKPPPPGCEQAVTPPARRSGGLRGPRTRLDPAKTYVVVVRTSCGTFRIRLDVDASPNATASFVSLVRRRFYHGTAFHRIVPGFIIQGGDPTGTGYGGAGYRTVDAPPADAEYGFGVVAMAKTAESPAGTASSQFFVVTDDDAALEAENAVLGRVSGGEDVISRINRLGSRSGRPTYAVLIRSMRVVERAAPTPPPAPEPPPAGDRCTEAAQPPARTPEQLSPPARGLAPSAVVDAEVVTNCGTFTIRLDPATSPRTAASFVGLARAGFYENTPIHRIVPGFVFQGGDPTGTGNGGPGYTIVEAPPANQRYVKGVVAMAKTPEARRGTSGSQFFVVTAEDSGLPAEYALLGRVTEGMEVVDRIGVLGDPATQQPTRVVVVERVVVRTR